MPISQVSILKWKEKGESGNLVVTKQFWWNWNERWLPYHKWAWAPSALKKIIYAFSKMCWSYSKQQSSTLLCLVSELRHSQAMIIGTEMVNLESVDKSLEVISAFSGSEVWQHHLLLNRPLDVSTEGRCSFCIIGRKRVPVLPFPKTDRHLLERSSKWSVITLGRGL